MEDQKILATEEISWYDEERAQLDYQMIFDSNETHSDTEEEEEQQEQQQVDVKALLRERDQKWKKRLKKAREHAFSKGYEEGRKQGLAQGRSEVEERISGLESSFNEAHEEWKRRQKTLDPGLLDLVFDIAESILEIPVENPKIREKLDQEISSLLHRMDEQVTPFLWVSASDYRYVQEIKEKHLSESSVNIQVSEECNPGEFKFETDQKTVVYSFRKMLDDFRNTLSLPSWN